MLTPDPEIASILLKSPQCDVNIQNDVGETALMRRSSYMRSMYNEILDFEDFDADLIDKQGQNALERYISIPYLANKDIAFVRKLMLKTTLNFDARSTYFENPYLLDAAKDF